MTATTSNDPQQSNSTIRQVEMKLSPQSRFTVPQSDGYSVYSALLSVLSTVNTDAGATVHDSPLGALRCSGLRGAFAGSDRAHQKTLIPEQEYKISLGIVHADDMEIFQALFKGLVIEDEIIELTNGNLRVTEFESINTTHDELLAEASTYDDPQLQLQFRTATCIEEVEDVTTMFPHRGAVFSSLLSKWNRSAPAELELDVTQKEIRANVIEKPDTTSYQTHSVLVNRVQTESNGTQNLFNQGFSGECTYAFKHASEAIKNAITTLALFAEYSGVGSDVARGCGDISVEVDE